MSEITLAELNKFIEVIENLSHPLSAYIIRLLSSPLYSNHALSKDIISHSVKLSTVLSHHPLQTHQFHSFTSSLATALYVREIQAILAQPKSIHYGSAVSSDAAQVDEFSISVAAKSISENAPECWNMLCSMLRKGKVDNKALSGKESEDEDEDEDGYWEAVGELNLEGFAGSSAAEEGFSRETKLRTRRQGIVHVHSARDFKLPETRPLVEPFHCHAAEL